MNSHEWLKSKGNTMDLEKVVADFQAATIEQVHLLEPQFRKFCEDYIAAGDREWRAGAAPVVRAMAMILGRWIGQQAPVSIDAAVYIAGRTIAEGVRQVQGQPPANRTN